jgi:hypothetical protein
MMHTAAVPTRLLSLFSFFACETLHLFTCMIRNSHERGNKWSSIRPQVFIPQAMPHLVPPYLIQLSPIHLPLPLRIVLYLFNVCASTYAHIPFCLLLASMAGSPYPLPIPPSSKNDVLSVLPLAFLTFPDWPHGGIHPHRRVMCCAPGILFYLVPVRRAGVISYQFYRSRN